MKIKPANLLVILNRHRAPGIYIGNEIPPDKLDNALASFPIGIRENVLALIDSTVFGSCKRGLAVTAEGLVWKNSWMVESATSRMTWNELLAVKNKIRVVDTNLHLGIGNTVELISQFSTPKAARLLVALADHIAGAAADETAVDEGDVEYWRDFMATIGLFAKLARIDGAITRAQIDWLTNFFDTLVDTREEKQELIECFNVMKEGRESFHECARYVMQHASGRHYDCLYDQLWEFATVDGDLTPGKQAALQDLANIFELGRIAFARCYARFRHRADCDEEDGEDNSAPSTANTLHAHYAVLGCSPTATDEELRIAFKRKMAAFHPDKLHAKGLADEFIAFATEQAQRINQAYDVLMQHRRGSPS